MKITFLGTGTSQGVPVIACKCETCLSTDMHDKRLRSSVLIEVDDLNILIDSGPDFRQQMLTAKVDKLDAIIFTHEHKDHTGGLDDIRSYNYLQKKAMPIYAEKRVHEALEMEYSYIYKTHHYPGIPRVETHTITNEEFLIQNTKITPIRAIHYKLPVLGYRIKNFTYITDFNKIDDIEIDKIRGSKILVVSALRKKEHLSHLNLQQALDLIDEIKPEKAYLTHISHLMGKQKDVSLELPSNVYFAYDELIIEV